MFQEPGRYQTRISLSSVNLTNHWETRQGTHPPPSILSSQPLSLPHRQWPTDYHMSQVVFFFLEMTIEYDSILWHVD